MMLGFLMITKDFSVDLFIHDYMVLNELISLQMIEAYPAVRRRTMADRASSPRGILSIF
jgi:hypothetical protein